MKKRWLLIAWLFFIAPIALADDPANTSKVGIVEDVTTSEGVFRLTDGVSVFTFSKGGTFKMEPLGVSGRAIKGFWKDSGHDFYTIEGVWTWQNWIEDKDILSKERKRMVILIEPGGNFSTAQPVAPAPASSAPIRVYQTYFCIEEVVNLDPKPSN